MNCMKCMKGDLMVLNLEFINSLSLALTSSWNIFKRICIEVYAWFGFPVLLYAALMIIFYDRVYFWVLNRTQWRLVVFVYVLSTVKLLWILYLKGWLYYIIIYIIEYLDVSIVRLIMYSVLMFKPYEYYLLILLLYIYTYRSTWKEYVGLTGIYMSDKWELIICIFIYIYIYIYFEYNYIYLLWIYIHIYFEMELWDVYVYGIGLSVIF